MCGAPKEQTVVQKTELDPALRRLLYGGTIANPRGGFGSSDGGSSENGAMRVYGASSNSGGSTVGSYGGGEGPQGGGYGGGFSDGGLGYGLGGTASGADTAAAGGLYAAGGYVAPQQGIASLNQGQMPMMNGQFPDLSDPMTAATLAMAVRSPQMRYGNVMNGQMGYANGGYIQGPGTGTSDSIPAKIYQSGVPVREAALSDGEFVMTKRAVDGAGGAANMYAMMKKFERGGSI